jgi:hypothetical protein
MSRWADSQLQISTSSLSHALEISTKLLSVIQKPGRRENDIDGDDYPFYENTIWNLDVSSRLWVHSRNFDAQGRGTMTNVTTHSIRILDYVVKLTKEYLYVAKTPVMIQKAYWLLTRWVSELLELWSHSTDESFKTLVSGSISHLCEAASGSKECAGACRANLLPFLFRHIDRNEDFNSESTESAVVDSSSQSGWDKKISVECLRLIGILDRNDSSKKQEKYDEKKDNNKSEHKRQKLAEDEDIASELARKVSKCIQERDTDNLSGVDSTSLFVTFLRDMAIDC